MARQTSLNNCNFYGHFRSNFFRLIDETSELLRMIWCVSPLIEDPSLIHLLISIERPKWYLKSPEKPQFHRRAYIALVRAVFHYAEFCARSEIFYCALSCRTNMSKSKKNSAPCAKFRLAENRLEENGFMHRFYIKGYVNLDSVILISSRILWLYIVVLIQGRLTFRIEFQQTKPVKDKSQSLFMRSTFFGDDPQTAQGCTLSRLTNTHSLSLTHTVGEFSWHYNHVDFAL